MKDMSQWRHLALTNGGKWKKSRRMCKEVHPYPLSNLLLPLMEKYLVPQKSTPKIPNRPLTERYRWKRSLIELNGRLEPKYRHDLSALLLQSYTQIGSFTHLYHISGTNGRETVPCQTHMNLRGLASHFSSQFAMNKQGISALEFDTKGVYLVSVTKSGCLTVHDFESFHFQAHDSIPLDVDEDETKHVLHHSLGRQLDAVRWNLVNQDEVACTSMKSNEVQIFDIGYISLEPVQVLRTKRTVTVHGSDIHKGLTDLAFTAQSRLIASDTNGGINIWDRRTGTLPCLELSSNSRCTLNSIQLSVENQMVFGAGRNGVVYMWDLRGGRSAAAFQIHKEACHPPVSSWKLSSMLEQIKSLKAQSAIVSKEVHSIDFDPSCPYQLAFHLDDGWSGILDIYHLQVTHVHCPPPPWLNGSNSSTDLFYLRKPAWLPTHPIYVVGSTVDNGIHLLDFYPDSSSPCHVDCSSSEDTEGQCGVNSRNKQNRFVPLSDGVTACAAHPFSGTIIAGTKHSSLLVVSQQRHSESEIMSEN